MEIDNLTIKEAREIANILGSQQSAQGNNTGPWEINEKYLIRTVTHAYTGRLTYVGPTELVLEVAAWIADTGRFHNAVKNSDFSEVEPFCRPVIIGRGAIVDATKIDKLPMKQK